MSRVGVWNRINKLRTQGIGIEGARNRGELRVLDTFDEVRPGPSEGPDLVPRDP